MLRLIHRCAQLPVDVTERLKRLLIWTPIWLLRHWAWLLRGYWRYRNLIDWLIDWLRGISLRYSRIPAPAWPLCLCAYVGSAYLLVEVMAFGEKKVPGLKLLVRPPNISTLYQSPRIPKGNLPQYGYLGGKKRKKSNAPRALFVTKEVFSVNSTQTVCHRWSLVHAAKNVVYRPYHFQFFSNSSELKATA